MHYRLLLSSHSILIVGLSILSVFLFWWQWQWRYCLRDRRHHRHQLWIPTLQCSSRLPIGWLRIFRMNGGLWSSLLLGSVITGSKNATLILKVTLSFPILTILPSPTSTRSFPTSIKVKFLLRNCANNIQRLDLLHFWSKGHSFAFVLKIELCYPSELSNSLFGFCLYFTEEMEERDFCKDLVSLGTLKWKKGGAMIEKQRYSEKAPKIVSVKVSPRTIQQPR